MDGKLFHIIVAKPKKPELAFVAVTDERLIIFDAMRVVRFCLDFDRLPVSLFRERGGVFVEEFTAMFHRDSNQVAVPGEA